MYKEWNKNVCLNELTLEAWIAIKTYPWNWMPIVQQTKEFEWGNVGYFLGVDYFGHLGFKAAIGGGWFELISEQTLARNKWMHVAASYNKTNGMIYIFINGNKAGELSTVGREIFMARNNGEAADLPIKIGKGASMKPALPIRPFFTAVSEYAFDGMIDEVMIYDKCFTFQEVQNNYQKNKPVAVKINNSDLQQRILPGNWKNTGSFGAYYTKLKFYDAWDNCWRVGDYTDVGLFNSIKIPAN